MKEMLLVVLAAILGIGGIVFLAKCIIDAIINIFAEGMKTGLDVMSEEEEKKDE